MPDSVVACSICRISASSARFVRLKIIGCGHSFCHTCLQDHMAHHQTEHTDECECPVCRQPITDIMHNDIARLGLENACCESCHCSFASSLRQPFVTNPCNHVLCDTCQDNSERCPVCDTLVERYIKNYLGGEMIDALRLQEGGGGAAVASEAPEVPLYVDYMQQLYNCFKRYEEYIMAWDDVTVPHCFTQNADRQVWNDLMTISQSAAIHGAKHEDFLALGMPTFMIYHFDAIRKRVNHCQQMRKNRPWSHGMSISIYKPI